MDCSTSATLELSSAALTLTSQSESLSRATFEVSLALESLSIAMVKLSTALDSPTIAKESLFHGLHVVMSSMDSSTIAAKSLSIGLVELFIAFVDPKNTTVSFLDAMVDLTILLESLTDALLAPMSRDDEPLLRG